MYDILYAQTKFAQLYITGLLALFCPAGLTGPAGGLGYIFSPQRRKQAEV
jgi:hypothetical protein